MEVILTKNSSPGQKTIPIKRLQEKKCVLKAFLMNHQAHLSLNFNVIKDLVLKKSDIVRKDDQEPV